MAYGIRTMRIPNLVLVVRVRAKCAVRTYDHPGKFGVHCNVSIALCCDQFAYSSEFFFNIMSPHINNRNIIDNDGLITYKDMPY
jgi:hypothetical protein